MQSVTSQTTLRDASSLADLANGQRWVVAYQTLPSGSEGLAVWWWYIGREDAAVFKAGREKGAYDSVQRRTQDGYELIGWMRRPGR